MMKFKQAIKKFDAYSNKIIKILAKIDAGATLSAQTMTNCYCDNIPPARAANIIYKLHLIRNNS